MRTATIVLAAVALMGSAHGAVVPRSEAVTSTAAADEVAPAPTEDVTFSVTDLVAESASVTSVESAVETSTETETETTTAAANPVVGLFTCLTSIGAACGKCMTLGEGIDGKCLSDCFKDDANQDVFAEKCPMLPFNQFQQCHDTLKDTCGKCVEVKGEVFGVHVLDVDGECFETCYWANRDAIREACPLPKPIQKIMDCHTHLAEKCGECVEDDHEIDGHCLSDCYGQYESELDEFCPKKLINAVAHLSDLIPDLDFDEVDLDIEDFLSNILPGLDLPFDIHGLFGDHGDEDNDDEDKDDVTGLDSLLAALQQNGGNIQSAISGFLQQLSGQAEDDEDKEEGVLTALLHDLFDRRSSSAAVATATEDASPSATTKTEMETESATN